MGSLNDLLVSLCMFWSGLHALKYLIIRLGLAHSSRELTRSRAVLPLDRAPSSKVSSLSHYVGHRLARIFHGLMLDVSLTGANIRIETTALNTAFDKATTQIVQASPRSYASNVKHILNSFYSLGTAFGLFGMALGYMLLLWSCLTMLPTSSPSGSSPGTEGDTHTDDEPLSSTDGSSMGGTGLAVQPIVSALCLLVAS